MFLTLPLPGLCYLHIVYWFTLRLWSSSVKTTWLLKLDLKLKIFGVHLAQVNPTKFYQNIYILNLGER